MQCTRTRAPTEGGGVWIAMEVYWIATAVIVVGHLIYVQQKWGHDTRLHGRVGKKDGWNAPPHDERIDNRV